MITTLAASEILARSTTVTSVGWIGYIVIGALAGWIASLIMKTREGLLLDIVIGVVGALVGGFLLSFVVNTAHGGWWFTLFTATFGAVILLALRRMVGGAGRRTSEPRVR
ncbi:GlsB/YeaQ/YmgE family stress response membrane protein [Mycobacterium sp.]|uniref:GlsB/YeaQ/YmgE family stress response membrane protein n=1 Tax=Mycobacterium sp. TaxID=1785 RepID=UPI003D131460